MYPPRHNRPPSPAPALAWRARLALLLIGAAALVPAASITEQLLRDGLAPRAAIHPVTLLEQRLAPLREALRDQRAVGYLAPSGEDADQSATRLYVTRYALAPLLVGDRGAPLVIADGVRPSELPADLEIARDFGDGLLLLRRRP